MFDDINKLYFGLIVAGIVLLYLFVRQFRPKTWVFVGLNGRNEGGFVNYEQEGEAPELHLTQNSSDNNKPVARMIDDEDSGLPHIWLLNGMIENDANPSVNITEYLMSGYIDNEGYIYKKTTKKSDPELIGYTARYSKPNVPTVHGERRWYNLWLERELGVFLGSPSEDGKPKTAVVHSHLSGISFRQSVISTEAKAGAAALFYALNTPKPKTDQVYKDPSYGWYDTALISSIVYCVLFLILYFSYTCLFNKALLGSDLSAVFLLIGCYFGLWAIIRQLKIDSIEKSQSFQPQLDMLNKGLRLGKMDSTIGILGSIAMIFTYNYYDYDFLPLLFAITFGVSRNGMSKIIRKPWTIITNYDEEKYDEEDDTEFSMLQPPSGGISKTFDWDLDPRFGKKLHGNLTVHFDLDKLYEQRENNPYFSQNLTKRKYDCINEMIEKISENGAFQERARYIARYIDNESKIARLDEAEKLQFVLDFVQEPNIDFVKGKESKSIQYALEYVRYPDETLYDQEGDSDCKAFLAAVLLHNMGYNVLFMSSSKYQHSAIGIQLCRGSWMERLFVSDEDSLPLSKIEFNHKTYVYCETTGDGYRIGAMVDDMRIEDFETRVEFLRNMGEN